MSDIPLPFFGAPGSANEARPFALPPVRREIGAEIPPDFMGPYPGKRPLGGEPIAMPFFGGPYGKPIDRKGRGFEPTPMPFYGPPGGHPRPRREAGNPWLELFIRSLYGF